MSDINRVTLIGRLTREVETKSTPSGATVATFTLANGRTWTQNGEKKEQTSFIDCVAWQKVGEIIAQYTAKGHKIAVEGRLTQRSWTDQEGNKKSRMEVVVENFQFLQAKEGEAKPDMIKGGTQVTESDFDNPFDEDSIPF